MQTDVTLEISAVLSGIIDQLRGVNLTIGFLSLLVGSLAVISFYSMSKIRKLDKRYTEHTHATSHGESGKRTVGGIIDGPNKKIHGVSGWTGTS